MMTMRVLLLISCLLCAKAMAGNDVSFIRETIAAAHPDIGFSTNSREVNKALDAIEVQPGMSRDEAWRRLSTLNPLFADAHLFVGYADWRGDAIAHLQAGGGLFPFEVDIDDGQPVIRAALDGSATGLAGARIVSIDGVPADATVIELVKHAHGDTPLFRSHLAAQRWWLYHWKIYGAPTHYKLELARDGRNWLVDVPASRQTPAILQQHGNFNFEITPGGAVLTVSTFDGAHKERFLSLTRSAFTRMRDEGVTSLTIDISDNGGGDDDMWLEGLMPYLATKPYRTGSTYTRKAATGETVDGQIETWRQPQTGNPLLFKGKVLVRIGQATYSSAILFANVMHDFGFATLIGTGNAARRTQSGGIRKFTLPNSGLVLWVPRFVLDPPAGSTDRTALLAPR